MHRATLALIALAALALASPAAAQGTTIVVRAVGEGFAFEVDGRNGTNPKIELSPGQTYVIDFRNDAGTYHNVRFGAPVDSKTEVLEPGKGATITFTVPAEASGEGTYWCDPHREMGMLGVVSYGEAAADPPSASVPAPAALAALAAAGVAAALLRRKG